MTPLDLEAVRLLSRWLAARRELTEVLDALTNVGPHAEARVRAELPLLLHLEHEAAVARDAYCSYAERARATA